MIEELRSRETQIRARIARAALSCGRDPQSVRLIWVSKTHPPSAIQSAIEVGARDFGENKVQEALQKSVVFSHPGVSLHIIGPVQSNKWRKAAQVAHWIHTVTSVDALRKYQEVCAELDKELQILFQINTSREASKSGLSMEEAEDFLVRLPAFSRLHYRGLMTIGANTGNPEDSREGFSWLRGLRDRLFRRGGIFGEFTELSMGMSDDLEVAITEGSTMVRVGTALFGARNYAREGL